MPLPNIIRWMFPGRRPTSSPPSSAGVERQSHSHGSAPLASLYRMHEYIVHGHTLGLRSEIEGFFNNRDWKVSEIPDPADPDPGRYAILSVIPHLLTKAFNKLIARGLPRASPAIIMGDEELDELASRPRILETVPCWCARVPKLDKTLVIPSSDGTIPDDARASSEFKEKNILVGDPPVFFV
jgi:hypothetical protein